MPLHETKLRCKRLAVTAIISALVTFVAARSPINPYSSFVSLLLVRQIVHIEGSITYANDDTNDDDYENNDYRRRERGRERQREQQGQEQTFGRPIMTHRDPPCLNMNPNCAKWASIGECQKEKSRDYMKGNCPLACNCCNPLLQPLSSSLAIGLDMSTNSDNDKMKKHMVYQGVPQEIDFDEFITLRQERLRMLRNDQEYDPRTDDIVVPKSIVKYTSSNYLKQRIRNILDIQDHYLKVHYSEHKSSLSSELTNNQEKQLVAETCLNRHPNCGLWAAKGFCELKPTSMAETCTLVCHFCDDYIPILLSSGYKTNKDSNSNSAQVNNHIPPSRNHESLILSSTTSTENNNKKKNKKKLNDNDSWRTNPFRRMDLLGIMEAIVERRVVIQIDSTVSTSISGSWMSTNTIANGDQLIKVFASDALEISGYTLEHATPRVDEKNGGADGSMVPADYDILPSKYNVVTTITNETAYYPTPTPSPIDTEAVLRQKQKQHLVVLDNFLSPEECISLLDTIGYGIGVDTSVGLSEVNQDGFPPRTTDLVFGDKKIGGDSGYSGCFGDRKGECPDKVYYKSRSSSRVYLYPSLTDNDSSSSSTSSDHNNKNAKRKAQNQKQSRRVKFAPAVERLLTKIGLITGLSSEVTNYIEYPIRVDKFESRDFEGGKGHFDEDQALIGEDESRMVDRMVDLLKKDSDYDDDCNNNDDDYDHNDDLDEIFGGTSSSTRKNKRKKPSSNDIVTDVILDSVPLNTPVHPHIADVYAHHHQPHPHRKPRSMCNARILGLTLFLNDVERGGGLEFLNADEKKGGLVIEPVLGRVVMFPTVLDLMGRKKVGEEGIDARYRTAKSMNETVLVEDLGTIAGHKMVEAGTKYSVTIYLRRYPRNNK